MAQFDRICRTAVAYSSIADFLVVYIEEAHPSDGWAFRGNIAVSTHRSIDDRLAAASVLGNAVPSCVNIVADCMDNEANRAYGGLFERLYVVEGGIVAYQGARGPSGFRVEEVERWLRLYETRTSSKSAPRQFVSTVSKDSLSAVINCP